MRDSSRFDAVRITHRILRLQIAQAQGQKIYIITSADVAEILPKDNHSSRVIKEIHLSVRNRFLSRTRRVPDEFGCGQPLFDHSKSGR